MKYAVELIETLTRTVIVEAESYLEAEEKVEEAYCKARLRLDADNSYVDLELKNDTENYIDIFGEEEFLAMEETDELY